MYERGLRDGRQTQIIATLGPASESREMIDELAGAGMDVARLNFSHASHDDITRYVERIRALDPSRPVAILGDLPGPKLRIGDLEAPLRLEVGQPLVFVRNQADPPRTLQAPEPLFAGGLNHASRIYLQDGFIELEVTRHTASRIETTVTADGVLYGREGMALPDSDVELPALTEDDRRDLRFAVGLGIETLALSFLLRRRHRGRSQTAVAVRSPRRAARGKDRARVALNDLAAIAEACDALMVARGDLGVAIGVEEVPIWQHRIIAAGRQRGIPVIVATEMLESMRTRRRPTRAEASDIAHAVWDGASGVMLSAETAIGDYPVESVATMDRIVRRAEKELN